MSKEYNGYSNYETWNVALHVCNDEGLYEIARMFRRRGYDDFRLYLSELGYNRTLDGVSLTDSGLNIEELDEVLAEL